MDGNYLLHYNMEMWTNVEIKKFNEFILYNMDKPAI
jgi:hypothetical protein